MGKSASCARCAGCAGGCSPELRSRGGGSLADGGRAWSLALLVGSGLVLLGVGLCQLLELPRASWGMWTAVELAVMVGMSGVAIGSLLVVRSVRRQARLLEESRALLCASELRYRTLAQLAPAGIFHTDPHGDAVFLNERWLQLSGMSEERARGRGWADALHPDDRARIESAWYEAASRGVEFTDRYRFLRPDGSEVWIAGAARPLLSESGQTLGYLGTVVDVSQLVRSQQKLSESLGEQERMTHRVRLLLSELDHRVRNNLGALQGLLRMHERAGGSAAELAIGMRGLIRAMAGAHELASRHGSGPVEMSVIVRRMLAGAPAVTERVEIRGGPMLVPSEQVGGVAIVVQELLTNAHKHGALAPGAGGSVRVSWGPGENDADACELRWSESWSDGPRSVPEAGTGLGIMRSIVEMELCGSLRVQIREDGLDCCVLMHPRRQAAGSDGGCDQDGLKVRASATRSQEAGSC